MVLCILSALFPLKMGASNSKLIHIGQTNPRGRLVILEYLPGKVFPGSIIHAFTAHSITYFNERGGSLIERGFIRNFCLQRGLNGAYMVCKELCF